LDGKTKRIADLITGSETSRLQTLADEFTKEGVLIHRGDHFGAIKKKLNYIPNVISPEAIKAIQEGNTKVRELMIDHYMKQSEWNADHNPDPKRELEPLTRKEAEQLYNAYKIGLSFKGRDLTTNLDFKAINTAEGLGLPLELIDRNPVSMLTRYANRAASAIAYNKAIANNPTAGYLLNVKDSKGAWHEPIEGMEQIADKPEVQKLMQGVLGYSDYNQHPNLYAWNRLAKNMLLMTPTAVRNLIQIPNSAAPYIKRVSDMSDAISKVIGDWGGTRERALKAGSIKRDYKTFDVPISEYFPEPVMNTWQSAANKASNAIRKYSGRNLSDTIEGTLFHALGETLAQKEIASGKKGDFLKKFSSIVDDAKPLKDYISEDIQKIASEFVSTVRGSYDARSLPSVALRGQIAPFLSLAQWSISKANTQYRDIGVQAAKGNIAPLLVTALTALGVGITVEEANKMLSGGKRPQDADLKETLAVGGTANYTEKTADLLQLAGFMGIMSDVGKLAIRSARGKDIKYSNPLSFPGYTLLTDTLARNVGEATSAIAEGEMTLGI